MWISSFLAAFSFLILQNITAQFLTQCHTVHCKPLNKLLYFCYSISIHIHEVILQMVCQILDKNELVPPRNSTQKYNFMLLLYILLDDIVAHFSLLTILYSSL